jgi:predicted transposase/invertase (TIGR01784 family)
VANFNLLLNFILQCYWRGRFGLSVHKVKDNSLKLILADHELFVEFLRDFIDVDLLKSISPEDVEDITERFLPLFDENKDSDTVKRIRLTGEDELPLYVVALIEHESSVNFRASFKMLNYITLILSDYEKMINKENKGIIYKKDFKYPPVLPVVFYDGPGEWTAELNFLGRTELNDVFYKYIPKFEYELVSLNQYEPGDLVKFKDTLSLIMLIDKIQTGDGLSLLSKLPQDYIETLSNNIPDELTKLVYDVMTALLVRANIPKDEIEEITDKIQERRFQEMFSFIDGYDVQETRRVSKAEGEKLGEKRGKREVARNLKADNVPVETIVKATGLSTAEIEKL